MKIVMKGCWNWGIALLALCVVAAGPMGCESSGDGDGDGTAGAGEESGETGLESGDESGDPEALEIVGDWTSQFSSESITEDLWDQGGFVTTIASYDNAENWAVTQNADDAEFSPSAYNKTIWTEPTEDGFAYCTVAFGIATQEEAEAAATDAADASDLEGEGCGGFAWSILSPAADQGE